MAAPCTSSTAGASFRRPSTRSGASRSRKRISPEPDPQLVARRLAVNRKVLCASPDYLARRGTPKDLEELAGHDGVLFLPLAPGGSWGFKQHGRTTEVPVSTRFETDDMDAAH